MEALFDVVLGFFYPNRSPKGRVARESWSARRSRARMERDARRRGGRPN